MKKISDKIGNLFTDWLMRDDNPLEFSMSDFERIKYEVRPCDVLLIEGRNRVSEVIKTITQSRWSHAALYIGRLHDIENEKLRQHISENYFGDLKDQLVVESYLGKGTIVSSIENYQQDHIRICRPKGISHPDAQQVMGYAISHLGIDYNVRQILDLARYFFPWSILPRRWRSSLFENHAGKSTQQICSTLLAEAFASVKFPILPLVKRQEKQIQFIRRNPKLCTPSDFDYSPYFEIIKYPLFEVSGHAIYRGLPWNSDGALSNDKEGLSMPDELPVEENNDPTQAPDEDKDETDTTNDQTKDASSSKVDDVKNALLKSFTSKKLDHNAPKHKR